MSDWYWVRPRRIKVKKTVRGRDRETRQRPIAVLSMPSVMLLGREIYFLCLCVSSWLQLSMVWSHTRTHTKCGLLAHSHTDSAFTIWLRWHLNNELSWFALPRLSPSAEVHRLVLLLLLIFNTNCFIQNAVSSNLVCLHLNVTIPAGSFN